MECTDGKGLPGTVEEVAEGFPGIDLTTENETIVVYVLPSAEEAATFENPADLDQEQFDNVLLVGGAIIARAPAGHRRLHREQLTHSPSRARPPPAAARTAGRCRRRRARVPPVTSSVVSSAQRTAVGMTSSSPVTGVSVPPSQTSTRARSAGSGTITATRSAYGPRAAEPAKVSTSCAEPSLTS